MQRRTRLISVMSLMVVSQAFAAGLGEIQIQSWLGQRLQARVPLLGPDANVSSTLRIQLAPIHDYQQAGIDFPSVLHGVEFTIDNDTVLISTRQNVNEPILELLLLLETPSGTVQRQYSVLLDLPPINGSEDVVFSRPTATALSADTSTPSTSFVASPALTSTEVTRTVVTPEPTAVTVPTVSDDRYGPVRRHESLWSIAQQLQPQLQLPLATIMAGLYNANKTAFVARNPHRLMEGSRLIVPTHWPDEPIASTIAINRSVGTTTQSHAPVVSTLAAASGAASVNEKERIDTALPVTELTEQNRQLRSEIAQLTSRLTELEARLSEQPSATSNAAPNTAVATETVPAPVVTATDTVQTGVLKPLPNASEVSLPNTAVAPLKTRPIATPVIITTRSQNNWLMWTLLGVALIALIWATTWWWQRRQTVLKPSLKDSEWQERKRAAREAHQSGHSIPSPGDWRQHDASPEAPNAAESMEIKLQYVRSAVDTFLLFQRYGEALAFIRREIFEAGHDSPLGHRLDALYRETKTHLQSLGIEENVPTGEPKIEVASQRTISDDQNVVTPLRKTRPSARRDLL